MMIDPNLEPAVDELPSDADSSLVSQVSLSPVFMRKFVGRGTALSRRMPGREEEDEWKLVAGRVEEDEWKVDVTPPRRGVAGETVFSDSELESRRVLRGRGTGEGIDGEAMEFSDSEESTCGIVGRV